MELNDRYRVLTGLCIYQYCANTVRYPYWTADCILNDAAEQKAGVRDIIPEPAADFWYNVYRIRLPDLHNASV